MSRRLRRGFFLLVFAAQVAGAAVQPILSGVAEIPKRAHRMLSAVETHGGWAIGTADGLVLQVRDEWLLVRPPVAGEIRVVQPLGRGVLVAGPGFAYIYADGKWSQVPVDDEITSGESDGERVLLVGRRAIQVVDTDGRTHNVGTPYAGGNSAAHRVDGKVLVFSGKGPVQEWSGGKLGPAGGSYSWGDYAEVISVQELGGGRYFIASSKGIRLVGAGEGTDVLTERKKEFFREGLMGAFQFGDRVLVATYFGGLSLYSEASGELLWRKPVADVGNICLAREYLGGVMVGTSTGLFVLPGAARYAHFPLPKGDVLFVTEDGGRPVAGLTTGTFDVRTGEPLFPDVSISMTRLSDGRTARGLIGKVAIGDAVYPVGGRDILGIEEIGGGQLVLLQSDGLLILDPRAPEEKPTPVVLTSIPNSMAYTKEWGLAVGSADGVFRLDAAGRVLAHWGAGQYRVKRLGRELYAMDSGGALRDRDGREVWALPGAELVDLTSWQEKLYALLRASDGNLWIGEVDVAGRRWIPLDLPDLTSATALLGTAQGLLAIGPDGANLYREPPRLELPGVGLRLPGGERIGEGARIPVPTESGTLDLIPPSARLGPWTNPVYSVRQDGSAWTRSTGRGPVNVWNLQYGANRVEVRAQWGGLHQDTGFVLVRAWPVWLRWPAVLLYAAVMTAGVWVVIRVRTRSLKRRAQELEATVESRTKELRKAQRAREEFFSAVSHEIRNPLNGVVGLCDMLHAIPSSELGPKHRATVSTLKGCADQLRNILDDVLDFAKIDRGTIQLNEENFDLGETVESAARTVDPGLERCTVSGDTAGVWGRGDRGKLRQIVTNLVSNALKYGMPAQAQVSSRLELSGPRKARAVITVRNTGATISPSDLEKIFEGFSRTKDAVARNIPGTGLGLAVSRRMARAMGGDITVTSANGVTEFTCTIAIVPVAAPVMSGQEQLPRPIVARALAIEDEKYNRMVLGWHLGQLGYEVDWADCGAQALDCVRAGAYDLILTDIMLPDTTGDELARKMLRQIADPKPPIIAVTAYSTPDKMEQARRAGISAFIVKPVSRQKLEAAILGAQPVVSASKAFEAAPAYAFDFSGLLRLPNGRELLTEYAATLKPEFEKIKARCRAMAADPLGARKAAHAFKSRVLAARATEIAEQLALIESAIEDGRTADMERLLLVVDTMVSELEQAAREAAHPSVREHSADRSPSPLSK